MRFAPILQLYLALFYTLHFTLRQEPHPINQRQICHNRILVVPWPDRARKPVFSSWTHPSRLQRLSDFATAFIYNPAVLLRKLVITVTLSLSAAPLLAQDADKKPQVQVNYLNVCTPSAQDQQELAAVLKRVSPKPTFGVDMEISRGRSTLNPSDLVVNTGQPAATQQSNGVSQWVRVRRDFPDNAPVTSAQYSFSITENHVAETLVFHFKDSKDVMQLAINDSVDSATDPAQVARVQTPADRIRVERFGKSSIVLARCPNADQSVYEPIFRSATDLLNSYRSAMKISATVPAELTRLGIGSAKPAPKAGNAAPKPR